jgi:hypothetical protein
MDLFKSKPTEEVKQQPSGFRDLLNAMMTRRWYITAGVLGGFILIIAGIFLSMNSGLVMAGEWKELLLLLLGAFIGSYGKIIDYWFSDTDKDKMLVQKMDEEDGVTLSHTNDMKETNKPVTPLVPDAFVQAAAKTADRTHEINRDEQEHRQALEIDEQEHEQEMAKLKLEHELKSHRQCEHQWGDVDGDGDYECVKCGKIKE